MDFSEKYGIDVDTAVQFALKDLKLTIDEVDVTVLEEPSRGFFGIGSKLALVRVEKKKPKEPEKVVETERELPKKEVSNKEFVKKEYPKKETRDTENSKKDKKRENNKREFAKAEEDAKPLFLEELSDCENHAALTFLRDVVKEMGLDVSVTCKTGKETIYLDIEGKDSGTIIGKRGQTLDAIQYLTSLVVNKEQSSYTRVVVDAESYRAKREKTLEALSIRLANKVARSKRTVKLEPMNPYERKVIHATLQNHPSVKTRSEGQDPYRRVIIELK